jgi:Fe-S-cluster containining protein
VRLDVNHPAIHRVDGDIFKFTFAADCIQHQCRCRAENDRRRDDACCQYGADVLVPEKIAILRRASEIASVLKTDRQDASRWFDDSDPELDPDAPGGIVLRTATADRDSETSGCVFLEHTGERGCGLHRAALVNGFDPAEIKPSACRLYPLSWNTGWLGLSPDFNSYSCADDGGPTVYRLMRQVVGELFDLALVQELDRLESHLSRRRLPLRVHLAP